MKKIKRNLTKIKNFITKLAHDQSGGSIIEYGMIIGFSLVAFVIIIGIITSILNWSNSALSDFFDLIDI